MRLFALALSIFCVLHGVSYAQVLFSDDFEGTLDQWVGKGGGAHSAVAVIDPLNSGNHAIRFSATNAAGDIFGTEIAVSPDQHYVLSFDYLGYEQLGSPAGSFGGFVGIADETTNLVVGTVQFLAGTCLAEGNIQVDIIDDGSWHSYAVVFQPYQLIAISDGAIHITVEDWGGVGQICPEGVPNDALFDNIRMERVSPITTEPTTWGRVKALYR